MSEILNVLGALLFVGYAGCFCAYIDPIKRSSIEKEYKPILKYGLIPIIILLSL